METTLAPQDILPDEQAADAEAAPEAASKAEISPDLIEALQQLDASEHAVLADMLTRATRDRDEQGPIDEISFIANDLKSHPESDDWLLMLKISEKVGPELQKTYPDCARIPLSKDLFSVDDSLSEVLANRSSKRDYSGGPLSLEELSSLLHQAYGVKKTVMAYNRPDVPVRFVPTTGGLQCAEVYLVINAVEGVEQRCQTGLGQRLGQPMGLFGSFDVPDRVEFDFAALGQVAKEALDSGCFPADGGSGIPFVVELAQVATD